MAGNQLKKSIYSDACVILTTKHAKSIAIAPPFSEKLGAHVLEYVVNTDKLGTFSGEIERNGTPLECARKKCEWSLNNISNKIEYALANEGSFGPHPNVPFLPCDHEIIYFIDKLRDFHIHVSHISEKTNYQMKYLSDFDELIKFANSSLFPSHALIITPSNSKLSTLAFKGIQSVSDLDECFKECIRYSSDKKILVQTDMRAKFNPTRMEVIREVAIKLADRLNTSCPKCNSPGWGKIRQEKGLKCSWCGEKTDLTSSEIYGCVKCEHEESNQLYNKEAEPTNCHYCNP